MGGVLVSTHSSLALAWTWDAVPVRKSGYLPPAGVVMTTRDRALQVDRLQHECTERQTKYTILLSLVNKQCRPLMLGGGLKRI